MLNPTAGASSKSKIKVRSDADSHAGGAVLCQLGGYIFGQIVNFTLCARNWGLQDMSAEVVDSNPYSRLMALQRMGVVENYERIRDYSIAIVVSILLA